MNLSQEAKEIAVIDTVCQGLRARNIIGANRNDLATHFTKSGSDGIDSLHIPVQSITGSFPLL